MRVAVMLLFLLAAEAFTFKGVFRKITGRKRKDKRRSGVLDSSTSTRAASTGESTTEESTTDESSTGESTTDGLNTTYDMPARRRVGILQPLDYTPSDYDAQMADLSEEESDAPVRRVGTLKSSYRTSTADDDEDSEDKDSEDEDSEDEEFGEPRRRMGTRSAPDFLQATSGQQDADDLDDEEVGVSARRVGTLQARSSL